MQASHIWIVLHYASSRLALKTASLKVPSLLSSLVRSTKRKIPLALPCPRSTVSTPSVLHFPVAGLALRMSANGCKFSCNVGQRSNDGNANCENHKAFNVHRAVRKHKTLSQLKRTEAHVRQILIKLGTAGMIVQRKQTPADSNTFKMRINSKRNVAPNI